MRRKLFFIFIFSIFFFFFLSLSLSHFLIFSFLISHFFISHFLIHFLFAFLAFLFVGHISFTYPLHILYISFTYLLLSLHFPPLPSNFTSSSNLFLLSSLFSSPFHTLTIPILVSPTPSLFASIVISLFYFFITSSLYFGYFVSFVYFDLHILILLSYLSFLLILSYVRNHACGFIQQCYYARGVNIPTVVLLSNLSGRVYCYFLHLLSRPKKNKHGLTNIDLIT